VRRADNLTPPPLHVPIVLKSRSLNLLEPSGPVPYVYLCLPRFRGTSTLSITRAISKSVALWTFH
jgi:hypothetical protein